MKNNRSSLFLFSAALVVMGLVSVVPSALASVTPTLSLYATGTGDNVQVTVTGDPNVSVLLYYVESGSGPQIASLGNTDSNGNFSSTISSATYGLTSGTLVHVILNGTSGPQSPTVAWPAISSTNTLTLNQTGVVISAGQSASLSATNFGSNAIYVLNNSNPPIANINISGTQITITGNTNGQTTVTLCPVGNTSNCPSVFVTVESSGASQLTFGQNNVTLAPGQNVPITVTGGSGVYTILNNTNSSVIQASLNSSIVTLTTTGTSGASSITVCTTDMSSCGIINATAGSASTVGITFSNSSPTVSVGQNTNVNVYGPSGSVFYISSNSNPGVAQINVSGSVVGISGIANGSTNVSVCSSAGTCGSLTVSVNYTASGGSIALSQTTLSLAVGQNLSITVSGGTAPYRVSGGSSSIAQVNLNGNILTAYGIAPGSSIVQVCSSAGGCVILTITVNGAGATNPSSPSVIYTTAAPAASGLTAGQIQAVISLLQSFGVSQDTINNVSASLGGQPTTVPVAAPTVVGDGYVFTTFINVGSSGTAVTELQKRLTALGMYSGPITGTFGSLTQAAVKQFQGAHGISQVGYVGPSTRAALNQ